MERALQQRATTQLIGIFTPSGVCGESSLKLISHIGSGTNLGEMSLPLEQKERI
jgi:hypothetical protein